LGTHPTQSRSSDHHIKTNRGGHDPKAETGETKRPQALPDISHKSLQRQVEEEHVKIQCSHLPTARLKMSSKLAKKPKRSGKQSQLFREN